MNDGATRNTCTTCKMLYSLAINLIGHQCRLKSNLDDRPYGT